MDSVLDLGLSPHEGHPIAKALSLVPDLLRGAVGLGEEVESKEVGEGLGVDLIRLDPRLGDEADSAWGGEMDRKARLLKEVPEPGPVASRAASVGRGREARKALRPSGSWWESLWRWRTSPLASIRATCENPLWTSNPR
jgi:hypothetical protein